jgi:hypothetical protein
MVFFISFGIVDLWEVFEIVPHGVEWKNSAKVPLETEKYLYKLCFII